jgi:carboxymethylenebutenolidase
MIRFKANGRTAEGYLAAPSLGSGPGVVLVQEWWGLVDHIKDVANRLAGAGFVTLAPDLYQGEQARSPDDAKRLMMAMNMGETAKDLRGAADHLLALDIVQPKRVAAMGFCLGGQLALFAACEHPDRFAAVVDFYGIFSPTIDVRLDRLTAPVLAHFGEHDTSAAPAAARALVERIQSSGKRIDAHFYDAGHAFFNDSRPQVYRAEHAMQAWERTVEFLKTELQ